MPPHVLTPAILVKETISLQQELSNGLKASELNGWIGDSDARRTLLEDTVWGKIVWPTSLGKPLTAALSDGFAISHTHYFFSLAMGADGPVDTSSWETDPEPVKWDAPEENGNYVIGYFARAVPIWSNHIAVSLVNGVRWQYVSPGYKQIDPRFGLNFKEYRQQVVLGDFTVSFVSF